MPPEWAPHTRTWMAWPVGNTVLQGSGGAETAYSAWAAVANAIAAFEPVTMVVPRGEATAACARLDPSVQVIEHEMCDSWMRDFGPTFVLEAGARLCAVDWTFNGWGGRSFPDCCVDALIARFVAGRAGANRIASKLVNEGGAMHVDGEGTVLLTESVQLNPNRNPNWTREEVESEIHALLGTRKAIWLPGGLAADYGGAGTDGHVDTLAAFARPGVVLVHRQPDPEHPDHLVTAEIIAQLEKATDARGRRLEVIPLDAPAPKTAKGGSPLSLSYVNFAFVNDGVIACAFDDPQDEQVAALFRRLFVDRRVVQLPSVRIFEGGGGIHCITQQEPAAVAAPGPA